MNRIGFDYIIHGGIEYIRDWDNTVFELDHEREPERIIGRWEEDIGIVRNDDTTDQHRSITLAAWLQDQNALLAQYLRHRKDMSKNKYALCVLMELGGAFCKIDGVIRRNINEFVYGIDVLPAYVVQRFTGDSICMQLYDQSDLILSYEEAMKVFHEMDDAEICYCKYIEIYRTKEELIDNAGEELSCEIFQDDTDSDV